ncbi:LOW QUALITY PROTEIN: prolactin regulatory element-binding protein-like [Acropora millepora]|uniref:LOW QUALITY PROTEIN: prolactin regulatory element-binding protein-like n=1 Tax=Acropora millepora TaxID=45264 RepID=UPI001CF1EA80|nr:LOW QUALITY PROTEIN: prolactin regulatory element-binding protein-like [Acropora millepora]
MPFTTLETTNFPLYAVNTLDREHFLIAGGGGSAKTGVPNAMNIYKLGRSGKNLKATLIHNFEAGRRPIMNCAIHPTSNTLAVGMDNKCQILELDIKEETQNVEKAKGKSKIVTKEKTKKFVIKELQSAVTVSANDADEKDDDIGFQKVVRFTSDGNYIVTGGSDGHVKILKYPSLECTHDIKAHATDVDDLDVHPNSNQFVTCSRDTTAYVWKLQEGKKQFQLHFSVNDQDNFFRIRACRFGCDEKKNVFLFTINVPAKFNRKSPSPSYLVKWDCTKWLPQLSQVVGMEPLTQMAVSGNGVFLGVGTAEGDISVFIAWNLALLTTLKGVHNIFVTGLEFLPDSPLVNDQLQNEFALLSISADNACKVTTLKKRSEYSLWWILLGFLALLYLTFLVLAYAGLDL